MSMTRRAGPQDILDLHIQSLALVELIIVGVLGLHQLVSEPLLLLHLLVLKPLVVFLGAFLLDDRLNVYVGYLAILLLDRDDALVLLDSVIHLLDVDIEQVDSCLQVLSFSRLHLLDAFIWVLYFLAVFFEHIDQHVTVNYLLRPEMQHVGVLG